MYIVNAKDNGGITILAVAAPDYHNMRVDLKKFIFTPLGQTFKEFCVYIIEDNFLFKSIAMLNIVERKNTEKEYVVCSFNREMNTFGSTDIDEALNKI